MTMQINKASEDVKSYIIKDIYYYIVIHESIQNVNKNIAKTSWPMWDKFKANLFSAVLWKKKIYIR